MKKLLCLMLVACVLLLSGCTKDPGDMVYKDTLQITNEEKSFEGAYSRYLSVLTSMKTRVQLLEECHNKDIKTADPDTYFTNSNYIFTLFDPFYAEEFDVCGRFNKDLTEENAPMVFGEESGKNSIVFSNEDGVMKLKFINSKLERTWKAEYKKKNDSFRVVYTEDYSDGTTVTKFLEFAEISKNNYALRSDKAEAQIEFNEYGNIISIACVSLKDNSFDLEGSIYNMSKSKLKAYKSEIKKTEQSFYDKYYTYENNLLTRIETGTGTAITIEVSADTYASVFLIDSQI